DVEKLIEQLGGDTQVHKIRSNLRCRLCNTRSEDLRIVYVGRKDQEAIFQYRR